MVDGDGNPLLFPVYEERQMGQGGRETEKELEATVRDARRRQLGAKNQLSLQCQSTNQAQKADNQWFLICT